MKRHLRGGNKQLEAPHSPLLKSGENMTSAISPPSKVAPHGRSKALSKSCEIRDSLISNDMSTPSSPHSYTFGLSSTCKNYAPAAHPQSNSFSDLKHCSNLDGNSPPKFPPYYSEYCAVAGDLLEFSDIFHSHVVQSLGKNLRSATSGDFNFSLRQGDKIGKVIIDIHTQQILMPRQQEYIMEEVKSQIKKASIEREKNFEHLPGFSFHFSFTSGDLKPSNSNGVYNFPGINVARHEQPRMGDSAGPKRLPIGGSLGPCVSINDQPHYIQCWHTYSNAIQNVEGFPHTELWTGPKNVPEGEELSLIHPSPADLQESDIMTAAHQGIELGTVVAYSGRSVNPARSLQGFSNVKRGEATVDWALIRINEQQKRQLKTYCFNKCRLVPPNREAYNPCKNPSDIFAVGSDMCKARGRVVYGTGRTSGFEYGIVGWSPIWWSRNGNESGDWVVDRYPIQWNSDRQWQMGLAGDSGAGIVDFESHKLMGQIWGFLDKKVGEEQIHCALFTAATDLFDDIESFYGSRPELTYMIKSATSSDKSAEILDIANSPSDKSLPNESIHISEEQKLQVQKINSIHDNPSRPISEEPGTRQGALFEPPLRRRVRFIRFILHKVSQIFPRVAR